MEMGLSLLPAKAHLLAVGNAASPRWTALKVPVYLEKGERSQQNKRLQSFFGQKWCFKGSSYHVALYNPREIIVFQLGLVLGYAAFRFCETIANLDMLGSPQ